jgi:hypothetical protein
MAARRGWLLAPIVLFAALAPGLPAASASGAPGAPGAAGAAPVRPLFAPAPVAKTALARPATARPHAPSAGRPAASSPAPIRSFDGLHLSGTCTGGTCGAGWPSDPVGDVGPNNYVEGVNSSIGIFDKSGNQQGAITFDQLWQPLPGTPCHGSNQGDPTVIYDPLDDRWIVADMGFTFSGGQPAGPFYECIAVSMGANPATSGWFLYPVETSATLLGDYPKMAIWPDGLYLTVNQFTEPAQSYSGVGVFVLNLADLVAGNPLRSASATLPASVFSVLPAEFHGNGTQPPGGSPEYLVSESESYYAYEVRTAAVNWNASPSPTLTLGGATVVGQQQYAAPPPNTDIVPQKGSAVLVDSIGDRLMMQAQYQDLGGAESLWVDHAVQSTSSVPTGIQWAQIGVSNGSVNPNRLQEQIFTNGNDGVWRWVPSLAVDSAGDMAVGYSTSSASTYPGLAYAGRLATDPPGQLGQGEMVLQAGGGPQQYGGSSRWGDYSAMAMDPTDGCTFWYVNQYYPDLTTSGSGDWHTRISSFQFPACLHSAPVVTAQPSPQSVVAGQTATFAAAASGRPAPTVQWQVSTNAGASWAPVSGATSTTLSFPAQLAQSGSQYEAVFTNTNGSVTSNPATLTVAAPTPPAITGQPGAETVVMGQTATFASSASANPAPTVQWQQSSDGGTTWSVIPGQSGSTLSFPASLIADGYQYRAVWTNTAGVATSAPARLTVTALPGYWMVGADGEIYSFGASHYLGAALGAGGRGGAVHVEPTPTGNGYWVLDGFGDVFTFGDAVQLGNATGLAAGERATSLSATPSGRGYWVFTSLGRAIAFGDAPFLGDMRNVRLNGPVIGSVATPTGRGYYMVATDGGIFTFGDARFHGSTGNMRLNQPVVAAVPTPNNSGYWLVASDGGVFSFNAPFRGSMGSVRLNKPVVGMIHYGDGYLMVAADGGIFTFSHQAFVGSLGYNPPSSPIVSVASFAGR